LEELDEVVKVFSTKVLPLRRFSLQLLEELPYRESI
jgi:hypothetical protein